MGAADGRSGRSVRLAARPRRPRHDRLPRGRERPRRGVVRRPRRRSSSRCSARSSPACRRPTCRSPWRTATGGTSRAPSRAQSYPIFCRGPERDRADEHVMLDCNAEAAAHGADGPGGYFDVHTVDVSPDHQLLAWSADTDGSERYTLRVRELDTGQDRPDELTGTSSWGGVAWSADGEWLFYARPDAQMRPHEIWRHRLGTDPSADVLVATEADERFYLGVAATRSEQWIIISAVEQDQLRGPPRAGRPTPLRRRCWSGHAPPTSSTASTTGVTGSSSSPTSTPRTSESCRHRSTTPASGPSSCPTCPGGGSPTPSRSPATSRSTSGTTPSRGCGSGSATTASGCSTSAPSRTTSSSAPTRSGTPTRCGCRSSR